MTAEQNKAIVRRWVEEVQNQHRLEVIDDIFTPDIANHDAPGGLPSPQGVAGIRQFFEAVFEAFPDFHVVIEDQIAEGDRVVTRKMVSGTHRGDFMGMPASGKRMEFPVIDVFRVADGKCTDHWSVQDQLGMLQQLGAIPRPEAAEQSKAIVRRFYEAFEANDEAALRDVLAPDLVAYSHGGPGPQDLETHLAGIRMWNGAFADTRFAIEVQLAEGDEIATLVTMRSAHTRGEFQGLAPTGRDVEVTGLSIERIRDGRIAYRRVISDWLGMLQQLGLVPPPAAVR